MKDLHEAKFVSANLPDTDPIEPVTWEYTGWPGHPRVVIDLEVLETLYVIIRVVLVHTRNFAILPYYL